MKNFFVKVLKHFFHISTAELNRSERHGFSIVVRYLSRRRWLLALLVVTAMSAAVFEGGTIGLLALAVSILVGGKNLNDGFLPSELAEGLDSLFIELSQGEIFLALVGTAVASQVLKNILIYVSESSQIIISYGLRRELQRMLTSHIMSMSYPQVSKYPAGTLVTIIDQSDLVAQIMGQIGNVIRAIFISLAYAVMMFILSPLTALVVLMFIIGLWLLLNRVVRHIRRLANDAFKNRIDVWRWTIEYLSAPRLVRLFNATEHAERKITDARDLELKPDRKTDLIQAIVPKILEIFTVVGAGSFLIGAYLYFGTEAAEVIPKLFAYVLIFFRARPLLKAFNDFRMKLARIFPRLGVVGQVLLTDIVNKERSVRGQPFDELRCRITFCDVDFRYPGKQDSVLTGINFSIEKGQTVALVGVSGAGKSTIADLLLGLYEPTRGSVMVDGRDLRELNLTDWRRNIGVVDQDVFLLNTSVKENIRFTRPDIDDCMVRKAAELAHAHEFIEQLDGGYETVIGDRGFRLSGGQQQRLALARALLCQPDILVLDEATSALDSFSENLIRQAIELMHKQRTILIIAHRLSTVRSADYIIVVDQGQIVEQGTAKNLLKGDGQFSQLWGSQMHVEL